MYEFERWVRESKIKIEVVKTRMLKWTMCGVSRSKIIGNAFV